MESVDTLVIGAGVIGLAIAAELSKKNNVLVIEQNAHFGEHTSSRNSEVIHAGIYYPTSSLKAKLCVSGKSLLYTHCNQYHVPCKKIGKVLIATSNNEENKLANIVDQAAHNGVTDLIWLSKNQIAQYARESSAIAALFSPSTGIIDSHQFMLSLIHQIEQNQSHYIARTEFLNAYKVSDGFVVTLNCDGEQFKIRCQTLVNAAGLFAQKVANNIQGLSPANIPELHFCRGQYFSYQGTHPFKHLIYPIPEEHGLGIHATLDLAGQLKFGPDTQFIESLDYRADASQKDKFISVIKRYWPNLDANKLHCDYTGIRPKLNLSGQQDFVIQSQSEHGIEGLINLFGIESPGLTASLAIAKYVKKQLNQ